MAILDFVIIGVVLLIGLTGLISGFRKKFFGKIVKIGAIVLAVLFCTTVASWIEPTSLGVMLYEKVNPEIGKYILWGICAIAIASVVIIVFKVIGLLFKKREAEKPVVTVLDKVFGVILGLAEGLFLVQILMIGMIAVSNLGFANETITNFMESQRLINSDEFSIGRMFYTWGNTIIEYFKVGAAA